jgi:flagellar basal-body rod protein FlgB
MKGLFPKHMSVTAKVMDLRLERQNLVSSNLANVTTPGYRPKRLEFEKQLQSALNLDDRGKLTKTNKMHAPAAFDANSFSGDLISNFQPRVVHGEDAVDVDKEMVTMTKNSMMYNALTQVIKKNFQGMQKIISDGAR